MGNLRTWVNRQLEADRLHREFLGLAVKVPLELAFAALVAGIFVAGAYVAVELLTPTNLPLEGVLGVNVTFAGLAYQKSVGCRLSSGSQA